MWQWNRAARLAAVLMLGWPHGVMAQEAEATAAATEEIEPRARAEVGGLHRAAASLEAVLDLYRVALIDLVPAVRQVRDAGAAAPATPATLLPGPAVEVFERLAASLPNRVPAKTLPVLARGYHAEVAEALERLGGAKQLGHVTAPVRQLTRGMRGVCSSAAAIVDLFSRQRPVSMQLVDPDEMLYDIGEALDEVVTAEKRILQLRRTHKSDLGAHFRAFRRLEVALGHSLDLIALAEEGGLHIGFEVQLATEGFDTLLARVGDRLEELDSLVRELEQPPVRIAAPLSAWMVAREGVELEARLRWQPPLGTPRAAAVRIYRIPHVAGMREALAAAFRCAGRDAAQADALAEQSVAEVNGDAVLVSEEAPGKSSFIEGWEEMPMALPVYRVAPVSAFGVEGPGVARVADMVPSSLAGATEVRAQAVAPAADDPGFYESHDTVRVTWNRSPSDVAEQPAKAELAAAQGLPVVKWYRVLRVDEGGSARNVGRVAAGVTEYADRLDLDELAAGLRYSVEAVAADGARALPPEECALSGPVRIDLRDQRALAVAGMASLERPNRIERERAEALRDPEALATARRELEARPPAERRALLASWWQATPVDQRQSWLASWSDLFTAEERAAILARPAELFCARDRLWVLADMWLAGEPPEIRDEADRWWRLLDPPARDRAVERFRRAANRNVLAWLGQAHADVEGYVDWGALRAVRLRTWVESRDDKEQGELETWWNDLPAAKRDRRLSDWYGTLQPAQRMALHFPDWMALTDEERAARLETPPPLPAELWRHFLAHVAWSDQLAAGGEEVTALLESDVGALTRTLTGLRYATRRLDVALGFRLGAVAAVSVAVIGLALAQWVRWRRRQSAALRA